MPSKNDRPKPFPRNIPGEEESDAPPPRHIHTEEEKKKTAMRLKMRLKMKERLMYVYNNCMHIYLCYVCVLVSSTMYNIVQVFKSNSPYVNISTHLHISRMYVCMYVCMYVLLSRERDRGKLARVPAPEVIPSELLPFVSPDTMPKRFLIYIIHTYIHTYILTAVISFRLSPDKVSHRSRNTESPGEDSIIIDDDFNDM